MWKQSKEGADPNMSLILFYVFICLIITMNAPCMVKFWWIGPQSMMKDELSG